jgi:Protein of unknown function (DUF2934)
MIDPKLNDLPARAAGSKGGGEGSLSEAQQAERLRRGRSGLSINDTIARDTNLSVGGRGVDTSGVESGSGAGAGLTTATPGQNAESPAPNVVPGARGSGTTPRGDTASAQSPASRVDTQTARTEESDTAGPAYGDPTLAHHEVAARAYECWHERGCPEGSPEEDWDRAERELRAERLRSGKSAAASA